MSPERPMPGFLLVMLWMGVALGQISDYAGFWQLANDQPFDATNSALAPNGDIYALANGLYCSHDNGSTWKRLQTPAEARLDYAPLALNSRGDVYITGFDNGPLLYRSRDRGLSWQTIAAAGSCSLERIWFDPDDRLFAIGSSGCSPRCFRSDDEGMRWSILRNDLTSFAFFNGKTVAGNQKGLFLASPDHGQTWSDSTFLCIEGVWDLVVNGNGTIFARVPCGGESDKPYGLLARSRDGGSTWKEFMEYADLRQIAAGRSGDLYFSAGGELYHSPDEGEHSTLIYPNLVSGCYFMLDQEQNLLLFDLDIFLSGNQGGSWQRIQTDFNRGTWPDGGHEILIDSSGAVFVGMAGLFARKSREDQPWSVFTIDPAIANLRISGLGWHPAGSFYAVTERHGIYRSSDGGESWQRLTNGISDTLFARLSIGNNGRIYAAGGNDQEIYLYASNDAGQSWARKVTGSTAPGDRIVALLTPGADDEDLLLATQSGYLFRSLNGGGNWYQEQIDFASRIDGVLYDQAADCFFMLTSSGLYRRGRMDLIAPWQKLTDGLPTAISGGTLIAIPGGLLLAPRSADNNFVDFHYSFDQGAHWTQMDPDAGYFDTEESVANMALHPDGYLYISAATEIFSFNLLRSRHPLVFPNRFAADPLSGPVNAYGVACGDWDNDADEDLLIANQGQNSLWRNTGAGAFAAETTGPVVSSSEPSRGATWGDYDNDGLADLFVANENSANALFHNEGSGGFVRITGQPLTTEVFASRAAAWADYDADGDLDLFVATLNDNNLLYQNKGDGAFSRVTTGALVTDGGTSYGCAWADFDLDGDADLFVANYGSNFLYRNEGGGAFSKITSGPVANDGGNSFGGSWGDYDNDGLPDLFVTNTEGVNFLYHNEGHGVFTRVQEGPIATDTGISKGSAWGDINNDGWLDLYVARNGADALYLNAGGRGFVRLNAAAFAQADNSLACAWLDANRDGFLDLVVANYGAPANVLVNAGNTSHWLEVRCVGSLSNRSAIGARVQIKAKLGGEWIWQSREISSQTGHSGQSSLVAHFGLGDAAAVDSLRVLWPSGHVQVMTSLPADRIMTIIETATVPVELASFTAEVGGKSVTLHWRTVTEQNNYGFEIERRGERHPWTKIGFVPGYGTTTEPRSYSFEDSTLSAAGGWEYRLKIIDQDGKFEYSAAVQLFFGLTARFELLQNYPNPFNSRTTLTFMLPRPEIVRIRVFSLLGTEVTELLRGPVPAGIHKVYWEAGNQANGVYFLLFEAGEHRHVCKAVLMK